MMEALLSSKVEFVRLFLEQGLSPRRFLTFQRLEYLYNTVSNFLKVKRGCLSARPFQRLNALKLALKWPLKNLISKGSSLFPLMSDVNRRPKGGAIQGGRSAFSLPEIGAAIERLMGNAFRSAYTTRAFKLRYEHTKILNGQKTLIKRINTKQLSSLQLCLSGSGDYEESGLKQPTVS